MGLGDEDGKTRSLALCLPCIPAASPAARLRGEMRGGGREVESWGPRPPAAFRKESVNFTSKELVNFTSRQAAGKLKEFHFFPFSKWNFLRGIYSQGKCQGFDSVSVQGENNVKNQNFSREGISIF